MVRYATSAGVIAKDINYADTTQLNLAAADHSNEEVVQKFNWREFSSGRSDDFGAVDGFGDHTFTLDDGTTSLVGNNVRTEAAISEPSLEFITTGDVTLTFVGTGLDVTVVEEVAGTATVGVTVNGSSIGTGFNTNTSSEFERKTVVSGLPFGTHTVKIDVTAGGNAFGLGDSIVYAPKKPAIPAGAAEIDSTYKLADYDGSPVSSATVPESSFQSSLSS